MNQPLSWLTTNGGLRADFRGENTLNYFHYLMHYFYSICTENTYQVLVTYR